MLLRFLSLIIIIIIIIIIKSCIALKSAELHSLRCTVYHTEDFLLIHSASLSRSLEMQFGVSR